jgi:outer membrane protein OmpA-like peptidoglycan-associated protein
MPTRRLFVQAVCLALLAGCAMFEGPPEGPFLVFFEGDSATLTSEARAIVLKAAAAAEARKPSAIAVLGYASKEGAAAVNKELSERRVRAVEQVLVEAGVAPALLRGNAMGEAAAKRADVSERYVEILLVR